jgi:hypothetical protein
MFTNTELTQASYAHYIGTVFDDLAPDEFPASQLQRYAKDEKHGLVSEVKGLYSRLAKAEERNEYLMGRLKEFYRLYRLVQQKPDCQTLDNRQMIIDHTSNTNAAERLASLFSELFDAEASIWLVMPMAIGDLFHIRGR